MTDCGTVWMDGEAGTGGEDGTGGGADTGGGAGTGTVTLDREAPRTSYWREAARGVKRAMLADRDVPLAGMTFRLAYEARGEQEQADYAFLRRCATDKHCVLDIGANVGASALVMLSDMHPSGNLYAIEPSEASCLVIRENARLNDASERIHIVNALADRTSGRLVAFHWDHISPQSSTVLPPRNARSIPMFKSTIAMDDLVSHYDIQPDLIKIDVEGAEQGVLQGCSGVLRALKPMIALELHAWTGMTVGDNAASILSILSEADYQMIRLRTKRVVTGSGDFAGITTPESSVQFRSRVLCVPNEIGPPEWLADFDTTTL